MMCIKYQVHHSLFHSFDYFAQNLHNSQLDANANCLLLHSFDYSLLKVDTTISLMLKLIHDDQLDATVNKRLFHSFGYFAPSLPHHHLEAKSTNLSHFSCFCSKFNWLGNKPFIPLLWLFCYSHACATMDSLTFCKY